MTKYRLKETESVLAQQMERIISLYIRAEKECYTSEQLHEQSQQLILGDPRLPRWAVNQLRGASRALSANLYRHALIFAYKINGEYLPVDGGRYKALPSYAE